MLDSEQLSEVTRSVWSSVLGEEPYAVTALPMPEASLVSGCVWVAGGWDGAVIVDCSIALARRATAAMFDTPAELATADEIVDAVGEIANMIGGNVKALMPGPSSLSLPMVTSSGATVSGGATLHDESFCLAGDVIRVRVVAQPLETPARKF